jgi:hypothetical protein
VAYVNETVNCFSWSDPKPIAENVFDPWPLRLGDGRIVIVYARKTGKPAIAAIVSENNGKSWSRESIIRDDAGGTDIGYPAAVEVGPGRVFAAYQYQVQDKSSFGGTRFIAGSICDVG